MKVLFAVDNDSISEAIVKNYQKEYKEIISYKNVYYFNAIFKELQNNKTYDRVVISEDLEPFANNNYDTIDKFLFEKFDRISDEATKANGEDVEIILICADRRAKADEMLNRIFSIGIYNALIGDDRNVDNLCKLLNKPRTKKEAKIAYKIQGNSVSYQSEDENGVSESEVQNILVHYKRLGKNEDKYVDSFNNIVSQYTDAQLRIIIKYLPLHVKAVLEEKSPKYQQLSTFSVKNNNEQDKYTPRRVSSQHEKIDVKMLKNEKGKISKPIVIPSELNNKKTVKIKQNEIKEEELESKLTKIEAPEEEVQETPKRGRGRPRKNIVQEVQVEAPKKGRGRPKKEAIVKEKDEDFDIDLFGLDETDDINNIEHIKPEKQNNLNNEVEDMEFDMFDIEQEELPKDEQEELDLFDMVDDDFESEKELEDVDLSNMEDGDLESEENLDDLDLFSMEEDEMEGEKNLEDFSLSRSEEQENHYIEPTVKKANNLSTLLTNEKKIVSFVGTTKNGTSFIVNNLGLTLAGMNVSTAILDMTQNKNSYYLFTNNEEKLRRIAENSISNLEKGKAEGINITKNLTIYTELPGLSKEPRNIENIFESLIDKHDVILIDTDFNTDLQVFDKSQEIYLVQSMDVLTIQPLTAFLRNLKSKGILKQEKIKIIINKGQKLRSLTDSLLIGGISSYNDPSMTLMTELFDKDCVKYCKIPFEIQNYAKYLDSLASCDLYLRGYTKQFLQALTELSETVYPLINKNKYESKKNKKSRMEFSDTTRNTLNKMKKNY